MDSKIFYPMNGGDAIYRTFYEEFREFCDKNGLAHWRNEWTKFIKDKNIGVLYDGFSIRGGHYSYIITDPQKLLIAKLTYGF